MRSWRKLNILTAAVSAAVFMVLQACANLNPLSHAETVSQKAYAAYGTFVIYEEQAAAIAADSTVPQSAKLALVKADAVVKPLADKLVSLALSVENIRKQVAAGETTEDKLVIATANLQKWHDEVRPKILDLVAAVQGARK